VKLITKKSLIIYLLFIFFIIPQNLYASKERYEDRGIISIMYHRFEENKYPSTNIRIKDFRSHLNIIKKSNFQFISYEEFKKFIKLKDNSKKVLLTIDDGFSSFYRNAWPILKKEKIPFIIFVNTESIGSSGYMNWDELKEISKYDFVHIGNHSHSHEYLVEESDETIEKDLKISMELFKEKLNHETLFFAYPFGEYKNSFKKIVKDLGFEYAFGQHSGVIDITKDRYELPRFPINEKYGEIKRFERLLKTIPFPYKKILPDEKYLDKKNNPPEVKIIFFDDGPNIKNISCYSNEQNKWRKSKLEFISNSELKIVLDGKFTTERGRINCSLRESDGNWRWLGMQFVISDL
tara:strand:+ start:740 stop:1789 length:1050 start_codon:yes stop_codon:yes gene_type:complete